MKAPRITVASLLTLILIASVTACTRVNNSGPSYTPPSCSQLLGAAVANERSGTGDINAILQTLTDRCSNEYEIAIDYLSNANDSAFKIDSCDELLGYGIRSESVAMLEQDGHCSYGAGGSDGAKKWPEGGLGWDKAREHSGTVQRVCGPLKSVRETSDGTFVNIGKDYPSPDRFTVIFWDIYLQPINSGATICGSGKIYLYNGVAQMEMKDPSKLEIWG